MNGLILMAHGRAISREVGRLRRISIHEFVMKVHHCRLISVSVISAAQHKKMTQIDWICCELLSLPCLR
jgi:hypothetical protein